MTQTVTFPESATPTASRTPHEPLYEVVRGRRVELPPMGTAASLTASRIQVRLGAYAEDHRLGIVAAETLFVLDPAVRLERRPDVAFVAASRWPLDRPTPEKAAWSVVPNLAIEVNSPTDRLKDVLQKLREYFKAGVEQAWLVIPTERLVYVYDSWKSVRILDHADELDGGVLLPGLKVPVASIFPPMAEPD